ncbi:MAG: DUF2842 domain-containing protein [Devosiaceae bacterium]|nr:DUF2842 domain-containing protein [Devosiaceae bacterium MH13]
MSSRLSARTRKIVGTFVLVAFIVCWAFFAMLLGLRILENASGLTQGVYYIATGCLWALPAMFLLKWMLKPDPEEDA